MHEFLTHRGRVVLAVLVATALMVGCGGGDSEGGAPEGKTVTVGIVEELRNGVDAQIGQWAVDVPVASDGQLAFTVTKVVAPVGTANFQLVNPTDTPHDLTVEEVGGGTIATPILHDGSAWIRASLLADKRYRFYCSIHRAEGMEGTIEVDPKLEAGDLKSY
jgi:plastocyanin